MALLTLLIPASFSSGNNLKQTRFTPGYSGCHMVSHTYYFQNQREPSSASTPQSRTISAAPLATKWELHWQGFLCMYVAQQQLLSIRIRQFFCCVLHFSWKCNKIISIPTPPTSPLSPTTPTLQAAAAQTASWRENDHCLSASGLSHIWHWHLSVCLYVGKKDIHTVACMTHKFTLVL